MPIVAALDHLAEHRLGGEELTAHGPPLRPLSGADEDDSRSLVPGERAAADEPCVRLPLRVVGQRLAQLGGVARGNREPIRVASTTLHRAPSDVGQRELAIPGFRREVLRVLPCQRPEGSGLVRRERHEARASVCLPLCSGLGRGRRLQDGVGVGAAESEGVDAG